MSEKTGECPDCGNAMNELRAIDAHGQLYVRWYCWFCEGYEGIDSRIELRSDEVVTEEQILTVAAAQALSRWPRVALHAAGRGKFDYRDDCYLVHAVWLAEDGIVWRSICIGVWDGMVGAQRVLQANFDGFIPGFAEGRRDIVHDCPDCARLCKDAN